jgi:NADH:ubiquinone oxidoreductase subunit E
MKIKLILCMGSSCYARGNEDNLDLINRYLEDNNLSEYVDFRGQLCCGDCQHGPVLHIADEKIVDLDSSSITKILDESLMKLVKQRVDKK